MTTENTSQLVSFSDVVAFARRRFGMVLLGILLGGALGFMSSRYVPKKYRSKATVTIQSSYFHHPLIRDVVASIQDTAEMGSQRSALLRLALNDEFLESFGTKYFFPDASHAAKPIDLDVVSKRIEYFATNPTTFQISVTTSTPQTAVAATHEVVTHIVSTLEQQRRQQLIRAQKALVQQATQLQQGLSQGAPPVQGDSRQSRIEALQSKLATLQEHLSDTHPDVASLKKQLEVLASEAQEPPHVNEANRHSIQEVFLFPQSRDTTQEIVDDLLRKISDLSVVLLTDQQSSLCSFVDLVERPRLPLGPFAPNRAQFTLIGVAAGLFMSMTLAIGGELRRRSKISPTEAETFLNMKLISELPALPLHPSKLSSMESSVGTEGLLIVMVMVARCVG